MHTLILNADGTPVSLLPVATLTWQRAIRALVVGSVFPVHLYDGWVSRSPSMEIAVPSVVMCKRFRKRKRKDFVLSPARLFLRDEHRCQYCGDEFSESQLTKDHVLPKAHGGGKSWENMVAACGPCNLMKGSDPSILPMKMPKAPLEHDLLFKRRKRPIVVPSLDWIPYLGWDSALVTLVEPTRK
jgi:5-methylcytosine-specific restriction endonuclease McrA